MERLARADLNGSKRGCTLNVLLHSGSFPATPALRQYAERQLQTALERFGDRVEQVSVRLDDLNGPRGGLDKRCGVTISLARHRRLFVEEVSGDAYTALTQAARRATRAVARTMDRWSGGKSARATHRKEARES